MKTIVISGINLYEGGTLAIYKDCLDNIVDNKLYLTNNIIAFVHKKALFLEYESKITLIELPKSRKSYLYRLWYEYIYFYFYSKNKNIDIWLSLHDMTPNVKAKKRYVYCHNLTPLMKTNLKHLRYSYKIFLFSLFYKYLYKINIKKNTSVIVQQDWIRDVFKKNFNIENVIVARPSITINKLDNKGITQKKKKFQFIYASYPRFFKNFEVICEASKILEMKGNNDFEVILTISGDENNYSKDLKKKYSQLNSVKFIGLQEREKLFKLYDEVDCMIFPSNLESWGLPITEFKATNKPILLANLAYAHETLGNYNYAAFFEPNNSNELARLMQMSKKGTLKYSKSKEKKVLEPYAKNWEILLNLIINTEDF